MVTIHTADTGALSPSLRRELRALLDEAFAGDFTDDDWDHALGGTHVWAVDAHGLVSHGSLVERTLQCDDQRLRVGFVEGVATAASYRRRGYGTQVMRRIGHLIAERHPLGVLSTGTYAFYALLGWERWRGPTFVDTPSGRRRTPDDDGDVMILRTPRSPAIDLDGAIVCDWRRGDVW